LPGGSFITPGGPSEGGWTIMAVHDSRESWEKFRDGILIPRMTQGIAGGFTAPPEETGFEIYNEVRTSARSRGGTPAVQMLPALERVFRRSPVWAWIEVVYGALATGPCSRMVERQLVPPGASGAGSGVPSYGSSSRPSLGSRM
jgi:hypothetical protein